MTITDQIRIEVLSWPGVAEASHRLCGVEFLLGNRELGHLHAGPNLADLPFPVKIREELVREGKPQPHHVLPDSVWMSYRIPDESGVPGAIELFRLSYNRASAARDRKPQGRTAIARVSNR